MNARSRLGDAAGFRRTDERAALFRTSRAPVAYPEAEAAMIERAQAIREDGADEVVWFLEHPALYTAGTSADPSELRDAERFPVFKTGRGGRFTYHGPGQRVVYLMLDLAARRRDVRAFVGAIEGSVMDALREIGVAAHTAEDRVGLWTARADGSGEDKIAAIGVRLKRWVSLHGVAINIAPDLSHFDGITPCGISEARYGVTSLQALGLADAGARFDAALKRALDMRFGPLADESVTGVSTLIASADEAC